MGTCIGRQKKISAKRFQEFIKITQCYFDASNNDIYTHIIIIIIIHIIGTEPQLEGMKFYFLTINC